MLKRRFLAFFVVLGVTLAAQAAQSAWTTEVLVLNATATAMRKHSGQKAVEIQNLGPNDIWCVLGDPAAAPTVTINKCRRISASGGTWAVDTAFLSAQIWCKAATADQVTGAATIVNEATP